ncbi:MAG: hypothetical protein R6W78_19485 [Bacteroidales bacterium]
MKTTVKLVLVLTMLGMMACGQSKKEKETTAKDVKEELQDVVDVSKDYSSELIDDLNAEINKMQESVKSEMEKAGKDYDALRDELKAKYKNQKAELEKQQKELEKKIEEFNQATEDKKAELKAEAEQLRTALDKSIVAFKKEMNKDTKTN